MTADRRVVQDPLTGTGDARLEAALRDQVTAIGSAVRESADLSVPHVLLLCGGFGRGEGAATLTGRRVRVQNDYDFELLIDVPPRRFVRLFRTLRARLDRLADVLAKRHGIKQIDIGVKCLDLVRAAPPTIAAYEMLVGHRVIGGDSSLVDGLPAIDPRTLPLEEGARLLLNRGGGLLIAASYLLRDPDDLSTQERENFDTELSKAVLTTGDLWLLARGEYTCSYVERARRLERGGAFTDRAAWEALYQRASAYKLRWEPFRGASNRQQDWCNVCNLLLDHWRTFEYARLGQEWGEWATYARIAKPRHESLLRDVVRVIVQPGRRGAIRMSPVQWVRSGHESALLSRLAALLDQAPIPHSADEARRPAERTWRADVARLLRAWHPEGEAGRVAAVMRR